MTRISIELIPRNPESLLADTEIVKQCFPVADTVNIPDLMRFPLRSWDAFELVNPYFKHAIPHIRAIDVNPDAPLPGSNLKELREVLIIQGDPPSNAARQIYPNTTESILRRYKKELPHLTLYAAFDPYRRSPKEELEHVQKKIEAGASGFFTQPVFDLRMLELCMDWLHGKNIFWGLSPVIGPKSRTFWEVTNHIVFPHDFSPTLEANIAFCRAALKRIKQTKSDVYIMPVRIKLQHFLPPLLAEE